MDPRRSIWGPVLLTVALLALGGLLPHGTRPPSEGVTPAGSAWLAPPSWPAFALRDVGVLHPARALNAWGPSWPVFALRAASPSSPRSVAGPARVVPGMRIAGPVALARRMAVVGTSLVVAVLVALAAIAVMVWPRFRGARRRRGGVDLALRVLTLAERGVDQRHIARHAGLPRDAVRAMLHRSAQTPRA